MNRSSLGAPPPRRPELLAGLQNPTNATSMLERAGVDLNECPTAFFQALQS